DRQGGAKRGFGAIRIGSRQSAQQVAAQPVEFCVRPPLAGFGRSFEGLVELREPLVDLAGERQSFGDQAEKKRLPQARSGGGCRGDTAAHPIDAIGAVSLARRCPAEQYVAMRAKQREAVLPGDRRVLVRKPLDSRDIAGEDSVCCGIPEGKGERVSVAELTRM